MRIKITLLPFIYAKQYSVLYFSNIYQQLHAPNLQSNQYSLKFDSKVTNNITFYIFLQLKVKLFERRNRCVSQKNCFKMLIIILISLRQSYFLIFIAFRVISFIVYIFLSASVAEVNQSNNYTLLAKDIIYMQFCLLCILKHTPFSNFYQLHQQYYFYVICLLTYLFMQIKWRYLYIIPNCSITSCFLRSCDLFAFESYSFSLIVSFVFI